MTKTLPQLLKKAQEVFNNFIRNRDNHLGCISCGAEIQHAGHYFSQGHYSALRYNEMNTNGQCLRCNNFLHGNLINYRKGLVKRYGEEKALMLENSCDLRKAKKWSRLELQLIIKMYAKSKESNT